MEVVEHAVKAFIWGSVVELSIDLGVNTYNEYQHNQQSLGSDWDQMKKKVYAETHGKNKNKSIWSKIGSAFKGSVSFTFDILKKPVSAGSDAVGIGGVVNTVLAVIPAAIESTFVDFEWILLGGASSALLSYPLNGVFLPGVLGGGGAFGVKELINETK